jgi:flagellin
LALGKDAQILITTRFSGGLNGRSLFMSLVINTNTAALTGSRLLSESQSMLAGSLERLSSGSKLTRPENDAAGSAVSFRFDAQLNRIGAARHNVGNFISYSQTQDGFLKKTASALDRMSELTVLAQDETKTDSDRGLYQKEFETLGAYITDLATKDYNGVSLFDGTDRGVTTDSDAKKFDAVGVSLSTATYTSATGSNISTTVGASTALTNVKAAINQMATDRATVGANIARLTSHDGQLSVLNENLAAANSRLKDVDVAEESAKFAKYNILVQAGTAMLAQANAQPQAALRLIG